MAAENKESFQINQTLLTAEELPDQWGGIVSKCLKTVEKHSLKNVLRENKDCPKTLNTYRDAFRAYP